MFTMVEVFTMKIRCYSRKDSEMGAAPAEEPPGRLRDDGMP